MGSELLETGCERVLIRVWFGLVVDVSVDFFLATRLIKHLCVEGVLNDAEQLIMLLILSILPLLPGERRQLVA